MFGQAIRNALAITILATFPSHVAAAATMDFETPPLGDADLELLPEFAAEGVTFTAPYACMGIALGLAKETAMTECAAGLPANQMLVTGLGRRLPRGEHIRLEFAGIPSPAANFVSIDVQTAPGSPVILRVFDAAGAETATGTAIAVPAFGSCGDEQTLTARARVWALAAEEIAYATVEAGPPPGMQCGPTECSPCAPGFGIDDVTYRTVDATTVDFESPDLGSDPRRILDPYVADGATFTAPTAVGLVKECALTACGGCTSQLLGTVGGSGAPIGLGEQPIRVDFAPEAAPVTCVDAEIQTLAYSTIGLHLFNASDEIIGTASAPVVHAYPSCGSPDEGEPTARGAVQVEASEIAAYAVAWVVNGWICPFTDCNPFSIHRLTFGNCAAAPPTLPFDLELRPSTILLGSRARYVTAHIEPEGFDPALIDVASLRLAGSVGAESRFAEIGDHDGDGLVDMMVKFSRPALDPLLVPGINALELTGTLTTGERIQGTAEVVVGIARRPRFDSPQRAPSPGGLPPVRLD